MKMILNTELKKTWDGTQTSNFAKERPLFRCHAATAKCSPTKVSFIVTSDVGWQLIFSGPLNAPPSCWHSSFGWSLQMSYLPCTKRLKASSLQWKAFYPPCYAPLGSLQYLQISYMASSKINDLGGFSAQSESALQVPPQLYRCCCKKLHAYI